MWAMIHTLTYAVMFLDPDVLVKPRDINSHLSPSIQEAILTALELHPDNRPDNIEAFKTALHRAVVPSRIAPLLLTQQEWKSAVKHNLGLIFTAGVFIASVLIFT